jgi:hypothetical protein
MGLSVENIKGSGAADSANSRASSRIRIQVPMFLRAVDATGLEFIELTKTLNISARGACIASTHLLKMNQTVQFTIPAPSASSCSLVPSETPPITAKVRRQEVLGDMRIFGVEFLRSLE